MTPSKRQRLFALLIVDGVRERCMGLSFDSMPYYDEASPYYRFIRTRSNAKPTSAGYPYHLALKQIEERTC